MSNLDQAFIRAYQPGRVARPATPVVAGAASSGAASSAVVVPPVAVAAPPSSPLPPRAAARQAMPTQVTDRRTRHYVDAAHAQSVASRSDVAGGSGPHFHAPASFGESYAAPSGYDPETALLEPIVEADPVDQACTLQPAYETRRFDWPKRIEVLIAAAGNEFSRFMEELTERIAEGRKTLVVTGCERGEGRTTLVLALARLASNRKLRAAIVDVDLRAPQAAEALGLRPELGWDDVVAENLSPAEALVESNEDGVTLLPLRNPPAQPRVLAGNPTMSRAVEQLREHFDLVLLDVGPLADDEQAIDLASVVGGCRLDDALVLRDRRRATPQQVQAVCRRLAVLGIGRWDIVENFTEIQGY